MSKWDRPKPPMDWRFWVGNLGKTLIATGLLMFGFVAYQLWGTGIETAQAQNQLENEFEQLLAEAPVVTAPAIVPNVGTSSEPAVDAAPESPAEPAGDELPTDNDVVTVPVETVPAVSAPPVPVEAQNIPQLEDGQALARLEIPAIGRDDIVVAGVQTGDLKKGPGHFPDTPLPGQLGNSAIAGHRTTYGAPFFNVDKLQVGDEIIVTTLSGRFTYRVTGQQIVSASDYQVVATTDPTRATLTLTSCHPKWTAQKRIVIFSELVPETSAPVGEPVLNYGRPEVAPTEPVLPAGDEGESAEPIVDDVSTDESSAQPSEASGGVTGNLADETTTGDQSPSAGLGADATNDGIADAFSDGWFSDPGANLQVGLWGLMLSAIGIGAYLLSRKLRRDWAGALIGIIPFLVTLYFFFQNVNRLLPPNL